MAFKLNGSEIKLLYCYSHIYIEELNKFSVHKLPNDTFFLFWVGVVCCEAGADLLSNINEQGLGLCRL